MAPDEYVFVPGQYGEKITTLVSMPDDYEGGRKPAVILAHGAGNDMFHPLLAHMAHLLERAGYLSIRFNFPYRDRGRRTPDGEEALMAAWMSVFAFFRDHPLYHNERIVAGGKSLGGRVALQASAAGLIDAAGLILLGYPLHPPGKKDILRDAPIHRVKVPMLFLSGSEDPFCDTRILADVLGRIQAPSTLEVVEGAGHSFKVGGESPVSDEQVYARILGVTLNWLERL
jgi:predicted alpha/beta-hydrolase family hydrolase